MVKLGRGARRAAAIALATTACVAAAACSTILGLGDPSLDPTGAGGSAATTMTTMGSGGTLATGGAGTGGATGGAGGSCPPNDSVCTAVKSDCIALVDNSASTKFTLRFAQINLQKPDAFAVGVASTVLEQWIELDLPQCDFNGFGSFTWLLSFDTTAGALTLGGAKPTTDPTQGYSFVNETVFAGPSFPVAPATVNAAIASDGKVTADPVPFLYMPIYSAVDASGIVLVPLHELQLYETTVSADKNCIGSYNASGLSAANGCKADPSHNVYQYVTAGKMKGYITLEEADQIIVSIFGLNQSLCVLLSNDETTYGDGNSPAHCKRDGNGDILFPGDWCASTNMPGAPDCYNALFFGGAFAANAVKLNP